VEPVKVLIVGYGPVLQEGLRSLLSRSAFVSAVEVLPDPESLEEMVAAFIPDVVITEIRMESVSGVEVARRVRGACPGALVLVLTAQASNLYVLDAIEAGALGYLLLRDATLQSILDSIRIGREGGMTIKADLLKGAFTSLVQSARATLGEERMPLDLTSRELHVLKLMAEGETNKGIAHRLSMNLETVKKAVQGIIAKLNARSRTHAAVIAVRAGLVGEGDQAQGS
jgi:DNA-binding NarL/FixJ family response regulator